MEMRKSKSIPTFILLVILAVLFIAPVFVVLINSFKGQFYISDAPFSLPNALTFSGLTNYLNGIEKTGFFTAFLYSLFVTVGSVLLLTLGASMTSWYLIRAKNKVSTLLYYLFVFSMIVPFQMVMFTMSKIANILNLDNPLGLIILYLGFGAGLSIFIFSGFVKAIPLEIEEAAVVDGCNPIKMFFSVIFPILRPTAVTVAILNTMWIWNDYLLPYLTVGNDYKTIPIAIQYLQGGYGARDMGALMAMLVLAIIPIIAFYIICQKYIIRGVVAGAVKG
ncbi:MAG: carbohydrate ABC transporter permease [Ruminococcaceae bacterium]|nr:carbohydrate ABC transporter permease [Oscillospiraceae bacterium]